MLVATTLSGTNDNDDVAWRINWERGFYGSLTDPDTPAEVRVSH